MGAAKNHPLLAYITMPDKDKAILLARELAERKLAAGANIIGPIFSVYRWQDEICEREEWAILAQTACFEELSEYASKRHPDKVPCVIALGIAAGRESFLDWIGENGCGRR